MNHCKRHTHPVRFPDRAELYLHPPSEEVGRLIDDAISQTGLATARIPPHVFIVTLGPGELRPLLRMVESKLTPEQCAATRCCVLAQGQTPTPCNLMRSLPLDGLIASLDSGWLLELLRRGGLVTHFQPIVSVGNRPRVYAYECLIRGRLEQDQLIYPDRLFAAARASDMLPLLDREACLTSIQTALDLRLSSNVFINFNPQGLFDPEECLEAILASSSGLEPRQFVFEVVESDEVRQPDELIRVLELCREAGFRVALDDLGAGYNSLNLMARLKPDFVKLDRGLIRNVDRDRYKSRVAAKLLEMARELHVQTVVEGVETAGEWHWAVQHGADFAQGFWLAVPDAAPPQLADMRLAERMETPVWNGAAAACCEPE